MRNPWKVSVGDALGTAGLGGEKNKEKERKSKRDNRDKLTK